jgi:hypothetical protein
MPETALLDTHCSWLARLVDAEQGDGWLEACDRAGRFLAPCRELVGALAELLGRLSGGQAVLEVCAGRGELAAALSAAGVTMKAVDADPPPGCGVERATAAEALREHRPGVVLGSFVPFDSRVDAAVLDCPSVRHYLVLGARVGGAFGSSDLWKPDGWHIRPLEAVRRWMLTRHDVWLGPAPEDFVGHGEAWLFSRITSGSSLCRM